MRVNPVSISREYNAREVGSPRKYYLEGVLQMKQRWLRGIGEREKIPWMSVICANKMFIDVDTLR